MNIRDYLTKRKTIIDKELDKLVPKETEHPQVIHKAIRYALKDGKRIRPILCLACAEFVGGTARQALTAACAIEMIHSYSLIHDDLPAMDNDDFRRGRPSCHKKFGEAYAILAGDALLTLAFGILSKATPRPSINIRIIKEISQAAGTFGMIGGQVVDISTDEKDISSVEYINIHKTGALISASCKVGAIAVGATEKQINYILKFGSYIGLVFQIVDDILDGEGMVQIYGPKEASQHAAILTQKAKDALSFANKKAKTLNLLTDFILKRTY